MRRKKQKPSKKSIVGISVVAIFFTVLVAVFFRVQTQKIEAQNAEDERRIAELNEELESEQARSDEIDEYGKYVNTKQFIEDMARERLGLVYPDEIIFKTEQD